MVFAKAIFVNALTDSNAVPDNEGVDLVVDGKVLVIEPVSPAAGDSLSFIGEIRDVVAALVVDTDGTGDHLPVPPDGGLELSGSVGEDAVDEHVDATIELANAVTG